MKIEDIVKFTIYFSDMKKEHYSFSALIISCVFLDNSNSLFFPFLDARTALTSFELSSG